MLRPLVESIRDRSSHYVVVGFPIEAIVGDGPVVMHWSALEFPTAYETLTVIYRQRKDRAGEVAILERFARQKHAPGAKPPKLLERLENQR